MTTHDSESDLAGRLGASLTPRVPRITTQQRGEQSSGLFDIGALYASSVEQVMRRARTAMEQPPVFGVAGVARPALGPALHPWPATPAPQQATAIDWDPEPAPIVRARGVGWFGVAVAWLATTAIGATVATTLPAHSVARGRAPAPMVVAAAAPVATATPSPAIPLVLPSPAPTAPAVAQPPAASEPAIATVPKKAAPASGATHVRTRPVARSAPAEVPTPAAAPSQPQKAPATAELPPVKATAPSAPAAAPAAGASLEELMRRAVEADAKKH